MLNMIMEPPENRSGCNTQLLFPQDTPCEILNGEPKIIPVPRTKHQRIRSKLTVILSQVLEDEDLGVVLGSPCNVMLSPWDVVQPDILFIRKNRRGLIGEQIILGPPDLIVEILSEDTQERDMITKRRIYADSGVQEYWIVDPDAETVETRIWSELGYISTGTYEKRNRVSSPLLPNQGLYLSKIFE